MLKMLTELLTLFQMYLNEKKYTSKVYTRMFIPLISTECLPLVHTSWPHTGDVYY